MASSDTGSTPARGRISLLAGLPQEIWLRIIRFLFTSGPASLKWHQFPGAPIYSVIRICGGPHPIWCAN